MASMSFTLTIGGVQFCLEPSPIDSNDVYSMIHDPPMISIRPTSDLSRNGKNIETEGSDVTALLNCFTGTLRISLVQSEREPCVSPTIDEPTVENHHMRDIVEYTKSKAESSNGGFNVKQVTSNGQKFSFLSSEEDYFPQYDDYESIGEDESSMGSKHKYSDLETNQKHGIKKDIIIDDDKQQLIVCDSKGSSQILMDSLLGKVDKSTSWAEEDSLYSDESSDEISHGNLTSFSHLKLNFLGPKSNHLHYECTRSNASVTDLFYVLRSHPSYAFEADIHGQLPIHVFCNNKIFIESNMLEAEQFALEMFHCNPGSLIAMDNKGNNPITSVIQKWINETYNIYDLEDDTGMYMPLARHTQSVPYYLPESVYMPCIVKWSFNILSSIIDDKNDDLSNDQLSSYTGEIMNAMMEIPYLIQAVLLITESDMRYVIYSTSMFRHLILSKEIMGDWICSIMKGNERSQTGATEFLEMITDNNIGNFIGTRRNIRDSDVLWFDKNQRDTINAVSNIDGLIHSMFLLDYDNMDRITQTSVVKKILNKKMTQSHVVAKILLDAIMQAMLQISYPIFLRMITFIKHNEVEESQNDSQFMLEAPQWVLVVIPATYFLLADTCSIGLLAKDLKTFRQLHFGVWNMVDLFASTLPLGTTLSIVSTNKFEPSWVLTITVFFIWGKTLGFLKAMNMELATYILALAKITFDIRWFLVVLFVFIFLLADVLYISSLFYECPHIWSDNSECEHFSKMFRDTFMLIIGEGTSSTGDVVTLTLVLLLSFIIVIIVLNVLIAVVSESYEKTKIRSRGLFGRARLMFLVKGQSLEKVRLHITEMWVFNDPIRHGYMPMIARQILRYLGIGIFVLFIMLVNLVFYLSVSSWKALDDNSFGMMLMFILWILYDLVMIVFLHMMLKWIGINICDSMGVIGCFIELCLNCPLKVTAKYLMVIDEEGHGIAEINDEWDVRISNLMVKTQEIVEESEKRIHHRIETLFMTAPDNKDREFSKDLNS